MTAAIYARVSTYDQHCDLQLTELRDFAKRMKWEVREYVDKGVSGIKTSRPQLDQLFKDAQWKKFDIVLCYKLDRFGRSVHQLVDNLRKLDAMGIGFMAPGQNIDTSNSSPMGRFVIHLLAAVAEFEREMIVERVKAGMREAKRQGKRVGRPKRDFNRSRVESMRKQGVSWREISKKLKVPVSTLRAK